MSKSEADALLKRVTELEGRLAAAEARIAMLEARPPAILPPIFVPTPPPTYVPPKYVLPSTTCVQQDRNDGALPTVWMTS